MLLLNRIQSKFEKLFKYSGKFEPGNDNVLDKSCIILMQMRSMTTIGTKPIFKDYNKVGYIYKKLFFIF